MTDVPTSPDITGYVPLALYGQTGSDVALAALNDLATKLPGVTLREGMTEVLLIETLAQIVADLGVAVDRIPAVVFEVLIRLFDVERDTGSEATTTLTFTIFGTAGATIPAGTEVAVDVSDEIVVFATDSTLTITGPTTTGTVAATATTVGDTANGVTAGTAVRLRSSVAIVSGVVLATDITGGTDPETDDTYFVRAAQRLSRLTDALVLPEHFEAFAIEEQPLVTRVKAINAYDGSGGPPYTDAGHITVAVRGASGNLSGPQKTALETAMEAAAVAMLDVHVVDPTVTTVAVTATVVAQSGYDTADVQASVEDALEAFLDPAAWPWEQTVRRNDLIALMEGVTGVDYVTAGHPTTPAADVVLTGDAPLADAGTLTITVT